VPQALDADDALYSVRERRGVEYSHAPADRMAEQRVRRPAEFVQERMQVLEILRDRIGAANRPLGVAVAAEVWCVDRVPAGKRVCGAVPRSRVVSCAVDKY